MLNNLMMDATWKWACFVKACARLSGDHKAEE